METKSIDWAQIPQTAVRVLTSPSAFFKEMPKTGGFLEPLVFMVAMGVVAGLLQAVLSLLGLRLGAGMAVGVASIIVLPILIAIFGFVGAAIIYVIWKLMGSQESYETAYRCTAYLMALTPIRVLLGVIPYLGSPAGIVLMTFFIVIVSVETHNLPSQKSWTVFGILGGITIILSISGEFAARRLGREAVRFQNEMTETSKVFQKQAEEARKAAEQMQKELQKLQPAQQSQ